MTFTFLFSLWPVAVAKSKVVVSRRCRIPRGDTPVCEYLTGRSKWIYMVMVVVASERK